MRNSQNETKVKIKKNMDLDQLMGIDPVSKSSKKNSLKDQIREKNLQMQLSGSQMKKSPGRISDNQSVYMQEADYNRQDSSPKRGIENDPSGELSNIIISERRKRDTLPIPKEKNSNDSLENTSDKNTSDKKDRVLINLEENPRLSSEMKLVSSKYAADHSPIKAVMNS